MSAPSADQAQGVSTRVEHTLNDYVNNYRLPTSFCKDHVEHRIEYSDRARGIRKAYKQQRWVFDKVIGGGGFGLVRLQKETKTQQLRAVKEVRYLSHAAAVFDPIRELTAMAALSKVRCPEYHRERTLTEFRMNQTLQSFTAGIRMMHTCILQWSILNWVIFVHVFLRLYPKPNVRLSSIKSQKLWILCTAAALPIET